MNLTSGTLKDLRRSGLTDETISSAGITDSNTPITAELFRTLKVQVGYYLPYFDVKGRRIEHFRVRVLAPVSDAKYRQGRNTGTRLYLPPALLTVDPDWATRTDFPLIITEGEKKALAATQAGFPTIAIGGINAWQNHTVEFAAKNKPHTAEGKMRVTIVPDTLKVLKTTVAPELLEITWQHREVTLVFDSDANTNTQVQQAAFDLAWWLEERGANVTQVQLEGNPHKVGLDDYLLLPANQEAFSTTTGRFPSPPNPHEWVVENLNNIRTTRPLQERIARVGIAVLDNMGERYRDKQGQSFFFEYATSTLHPFRSEELGALRETSFGNLINNTLGIRTADTAIMSRFADMFATRAPVETIDPERVIAHRGDTIYYQLNDGEMARITADGITITANGEDGVLFLPDTVFPIDADELTDKLSHPPQQRWLSALRTVNLQPLLPLNIDQTQKLLATLFYMAPWLNRWRGLQLPMEVAVAEPNSGKTFLYNLRKGILTGSPELEGLPDDFRGWVSSVSAAPAIWVCDNLGSVKSDYWHRLNDELARLVTDPYPSIELRRLYTTSSISRIPIRASFAITTIKNPFTAPDILQRSLVFHLHAIPALQRNSNWYQAQLRDRTAWVAEHLQYLQRFLQNVSARWDPDYMSGYRLVHFEQGLLRMGEALGWGPDIVQIVAELPRVVSEAVAEYDPVIEALRAFADEWEAPEATISDIVTWVDADEDQRFSAIKTLGNVILLGRYVRAHEYDVQESTGLIRIHRQNQTIFKLTRRQE